MSSPPPSPVPRVDTTVNLLGETVDLRAHALTAGVVAPPRFGRESEVVATVDAVIAAGADLVDVSLEPGLIGPAARHSRRPVVSRVDGPEAARAARSAGAAMLLVPPAVAADVVADAAHAGGPGPAGGVVPVAVLVDDVDAIGAARAVAERLGAPLAIDTTRRRAIDALTQEAAAIVAGCRVVRTVEVRRTRRVVEVLAALIESRAATSERR